MGRCNLTGGYNCRYSQHITSNSYERSNNNKTTLRKEFYFVFIFAKRDIIIYFLLLHRRKGTFNTRILNFS